MTSPELNLSSRPSVPFVIVLASSPFWELMKSDRDSFMRSIATIPIFHLSIDELFTLGLII